MVGTNICVYVNACVCRYMKMDEYRSEVFHINKRCHLLPSAENLLSISESMAIHRKED